MVQLTTDICHVTGVGNPVDDTLSGLEANAVQLDHTLPTVDFDAMAKAQSYDTGMQKLQSSTIPYNGLYSKQKFSYRHW